LGSRAVYPSRAQGASKHGLDRRNGPCYPSTMDTRITDLEETAAHLTKTVDELSDIIARQDTDIALLTRKVQLLMEREAGREASEGAAVVVGDERPPHY